MRDFLVFRRMITPFLIQMIFWIAVVLCLFAGIAGIVQGESAKRGGDELIVAGVALLIAGPLLCRVYCEVLILFFRMNETLTDIRKSFVNSPSLASRQRTRANIEGEEPIEL
ncbi:MAG: DUF4282 domain-containing protein [Planctomycetes bacterium]|nr:DUF4282 domain-containing protein [Planctomycetota bacterium]